MAARVFEKNTFGRKGCRGCKVLAIIWQRFVKAKRCGMIPPNFHKKRTHIHIIQSIKEHRSV